MRPERDPDYRNLAWIIIFFALFVVFLVLGQIRCSDPPGYYQKPLAPPDKVRLVEPPRARFSGDPREC